MKRILSTILALCMVFTIGSTAAFAAAPKAQEKCFTPRFSECIDLRPNMVLTFRTGMLDVTTVKFVKGEPGQTLSIPDTFCLGRHTKDVTTWVPVDSWNFEPYELKAGSQVTLDYDSIRDLFGVRFSSTVIKMIGK